ncbi:MAG: hypothetical protein MI723_19495 [Caulobacterales bacterium]|nr:hypothetical protein [Caulobacterales bacterium]
MVGGFSDLLSERLCDDYKVDLNRYADNRRTVVGAIERGAWFGIRCLDFLARHPGGHALNLGAGLNTSYERVRARAPDGDWGGSTPILSPSSRRAADIAAYDPRWRLIAESTAPMTRVGLAPASFALVFGLFTGGRRIYGCAHAQAS